MKYALAWSRYNFPFISVFLAIAVNLCVSVIFDRTYNFTFNFCKIVNLFNSRLVFLHYVSSKLLRAFCLIPSSWYFFIALLRAFSRFRSVFSNILIFHTFLKPFFKTFCLRNIYYFNLKSFFDYIFLFFILLFSFLVLVKFLITCSFCSFFLLFLQSFILFSLFWLFSCTELIILY